LAAMAVGHQPLTFQWQRNGTDLPDATNAVLTLANAQLDDAAEYAVTVSNTNGAVASSNAALTILSPPVIRGQPSDDAEVVGAPALFTVTAVGTPPLSYQWRFNGADIVGATESNYGLLAVQPTDAGTYSVVVSNAWGVAVSSNATLTVLTPPSITTQPSNQTVVAGGSVSFSVEAASAIQLNYQWYFNQTNLLVDAEGATLSLTDVQAAQAGDYSVVVDNAAGAVTSAVATLTVLIPPSIITQLSDQAAVAGANVSFTVEANGSAPLDYQWYFNQTNVLAGAEGTTLSLTNVQPGQAGNYSVLAHNAAGSVVSAATLTVLVPGIFLTAPSITADGAFQFNVGGEAGSSYIIEASTNFTEWFPLETDTSPFTFSDTNALSLPLRFYRARGLP